MHVWAVPYRYHGKPLLCPCICVWVPVRVSVCLTISIKLGNHRGVTRRGFQLMLEWFTSMVWGHILTNHTQFYVYTKWWNLTHSYPISWLVSLYIPSYKLWQDTAYNNNWLNGLVKLKVQTTIKDDCSVRVFDYC